MPIAVSAARLAHLASRMGPGLRAQAATEAVSQTIALPHASMRPAGSTTIGVSLDERDELREGVLLIALGALGVGLASGYLLALRRASKRPNPRRRSSRRRDSLP